MMRVLVLIVLAGLGGRASGQRLPGNVRPEHYALEMAPVIERGTFSGVETIDVDLGLASKTVTLNSLDLSIGPVESGGQTGAVSYDVGKQQATFTFARALPAGANSIAIGFAGKLNDKLRGFYLSKTATRTYAVTQFEATDARRAFPCFDEPGLKATFDVSVTVDQRDSVIGNGAVVGDRVVAGARHTVVFGRTPRMSTYLVAFLVGDFACEKGKADGVPIRVCSTPEKVTLTKFALKAAEHFLVYYDQYFGIKYPMEKLDLIAIPDFEAGAMENFGAITYRETDLLVEDEEGSTGAKKHVATVVAHEMAHQWFGDMVTMQWWDNLWLNEGFATWMEYKAANDWHPEWGFPADVAGELDGTLNYDAVKTTRAIRARAETPAEIQEQFDGIAYGKAGAVLGMVENWVGAEVFRAGVHRYLAAHLYANATAEDFWGTLTATAKLPVDQVMASFVEKPGVPLLTFEDRKGTGAYAVEQSRFLVGGGGSESRPGWVIPVCVKSTAGQGCQVVPGGATAVKAGEGQPFFFANAGAKGYYRVAYTPEQVRAITAGAETRLTVPERISFLGDRWALVQTGQAEVGEFLDLALALKRDPNAAVLDSVLGSVGVVRSRIATAAERAQLNAIILREFGPVYTALGRDGRGLAGGTAEQQQERADLFRALGQAGDAGVLAHARAVTTDLFAGKKVAEPNLVDAAVALTAQTGDEALYDRMLVVAQKADDPGLQTEALEILTKFEQPVLVVKTLQYAVSGKVRNQDSWSLIAAELAQRETAELAWNWVQLHWDRVAAQLTTGSGGNLISATGTFCSVQERDEVAAFFAAHKVEASERALGKALDSIDACVAMRARQEPALKGWLAGR